MPELGEYAGYVLWSWGVSLLLIGALVVQSFRRAARVREELRRIEGGKDGD